MATCGPISVCFPYFLCGVMFTCFTLVIKARLPCKPLEVMDLYSIRTISRTRKTKTHNNPILAVFPITTPLNPSTSALVSKAHLSLRYHSSHTFSRTTLTPKLLILPSFGTRTHATCCSVSFEHRQVGVSRLRLVIQSRYALQH